MIKSADGAGNEKVRRRKEVRKYSVPIRVYKDRSSRTNFKWATVLVTKPGATAAATAPATTAIVIMVLHLPPPRASLRAPAAIPAVMVVVVTDKNGEFYMSLELKTSLCSMKEVVLYLSYAWKENVIILWRRASTSELRLYPSLILLNFRRSDLLLRNFFVKDHSMLINNI
jgi:hypothetical protein